jgi:hypothetical protein
MACQEGCAEETRENFLGVKEGILKIGKQSE